MAKFRFKFESVLRHRQATEDCCQRDLAKVLRQKMILKTQLRTMQETRTSSKHALVDGLVGAVDLGSMSHFSRYSDQMTHRVRQIVLRLASLESQIDASRQRLLDAIRHRKALELLSQRYRQCWRRAHQMRENAELDALGTRPSLEPPCEFRA